MRQDAFNPNIADSQVTEVGPIAPENFDFNKYQEYEASLQERNKNFWKSDSGLMVYRRVRAPGIFLDACREKEKTLALQLGALQESMRYKSDIANYLEPWYGVGVFCSSFGAKYKWLPGQAPAVLPLYDTIEQCLQADVMPVEKTEVGGRIIEMIEYFLDKTKGRLPICATDNQSPLNAASLLVETNNFFMSIIDGSNNLKKLLARITDVLVDFTRKQKDLIGDCMVKPGHGFASTKVFDGIGFSEDCVTMLSDEHYSDIAKPFVSRAAKPFGGAAFHSCGNWSGKIASVKQIENLLMVDGAFSKQTDPSPNPCEPFAEHFSGSKTILQVRIVGDHDTIMEKVRKLWRPPMRLIVVTNCQSPSEQEKVYNSIHELG